MMPSAETQGPHSPEHARTNPDPYGKAALLLTESLIHSLVDARSLTNKQAIEAIEIAIEVEFDAGRFPDRSAKRVDGPIELLSRMAESFQTDRAI